ncbi:MAG: FHA domain-containing protein [Caldisericia bacterium]|nr:FHA domain-containing protein [Caldisericia bacterium]
MKKIALLIAVVCLVPTMVIGLELKSFESKTWPNARATVSLSKDISNPKFLLDVYGEQFEGKTSKIEDQGDPINVVFCVDISQSVGYNLKSLKPIMADITSLFANNDTFSMMVFSGTVEIPIKFSTNPSEAAVLMGELAAKETDTYVFEALDQARELLDSQPDRKGVIFLFSDGDDTGSKNKDMISDKYPIIILAPPANVKVHVLTSIAKQTNGLYYPSGSFNHNELKTYINKLKQWNESLYSIDFSNLPNLSSGSYEIVLIADNGNTSEKVPVKFSIEGKTSFVWVWFVIAGLLLVALVFWVISIKKTHVPKGKKVVEKQVDADLHYLAWISLADDDDSQFRIRKNKVLIGTDPGADFFVDDPTVSVKHAIIFEKADGFYVSDAESVMGTFLNKKRVLEPQKLNDGDIIRVGDTDLKFTQSDFAYTSKKKVI